MTRSIITTLTLCALSVLVTGCPEDNNTPPQQNNARKDMSPQEDMTPDQSEDMTSDSGKDMPIGEDMPSDQTEDMAAAEATDCTWLRTEPATLPLDGQPHDIRLILGCNGTIPQDGISIEREMGNNGTIEGITCKAGDEGGPKQLCTVDVSDIKPPGGSQAKDAGAYPTKLILISHNGEGNMADYLRWHATPTQLAEAAKDLQVHTAPDGQGPKGLGLHLKAIDADNAISFGVHAKGATIEEQPGKQRQEILKNLTFDFGKIAKTGEVSAPKSQTVNFGAGNLVYQNSDLVRLTKGFKAYWWGQVNNPATQTSTLVGATWNIDETGQPDAQPKLLTPAADAFIDPITSTINSHLFATRDNNNVVQHAIAALHTTKSGKFQISAQFIDNTTSAKGSAPIDKFGVVTTSDIQNNTGWAGLIATPVQFPNAANFPVIGWSAIATPRGVDFSVIDLEDSPNGAPLFVRELAVPFDVTAVHMGLSRTTQLFVLLTGAQGQQQLFTTPAAELSQIAFSQIAMPPNANFTPEPLVPPTSAFAFALNDDADLVPFHQNNDTITLLGHHTPRPRTARIRFRRAMKTALASTMRMGANPRITSVSPIQIDAAAPLNFKANNITTINNVNSASYGVKDPNGGCVLTTSVCHFMTSATGNGITVGLNGGPANAATPQLTAIVDADDGKTIDAVLDTKTLPVASSNWYAPAIVELNDEWLVWMPIKTKTDTVDARQADALVYWFVSKQGVATAPSMIRFNTRIAHETTLIAGMGTEVVVFFSNIRKEGTLATIPVANLKAVKGDTPQAYTVTGKNLGALSNTRLAPQLFGANALNKPYGRTLKAGMSLRLPPLDRGMLYLSGDGCGTINAVTLNTDPQPVSLFNDATNDQCTDQEIWAVRGDFLGTDTQQLLTFNGTTFSMISMTSDFQIPEKVVMEKDSDFYGLAANTPPVQGVVSQDFNGDGLIDVAIDNGDPAGVTVLFSDGLGGTLPSSGIIPGFSTAISTSPGDTTIQAHGGKGTKISASETSAKPELL